MTARSDPFGARGRLKGDWGEVTYYRLPALAARGLADLDKLPYTVKVLLENVLRRCGDGIVAEDEVVSLAGWASRSSPQGELSFLPGRVLLQDLTGVPAVVDLAAMRSAMARMGGDPSRINPLVPADLVIDHSVQIDSFGSCGAFEANVKKEYERNSERYGLLRWAQQAFRNFRIVPPDTGICHQIDLEHLSTVVASRQAEGVTIAFPDSLVGADSHTTMVNGLGVLAWGVGGIEAEAVMLGQPLYMLMPEVVGVRLQGRLPEGISATDLVLTITQILRKRGVVNKFVEYTGAGVRQLSLADRAVVSNMCPEYGATAAIFPVDAETLSFLRLTGHEETQVRLVERYLREQGMFRTEETPEPSFSEVVDIDLSQIVRSLAGPRRPQDRVPLAEVGRSFRAAYPDLVAAAPAAVPVNLGGLQADISHGAVALAAISSCTNTSNPAGMIAAGLLARNAVQRGLSTRPWVKTSLAPGSRAVASYLESAGLMPYLEALRFHLVAFGCTTCLGNSGPLPGPMAEAVRDHKLVVAAVLSGNRNFEGRIHPQVRASYLASPALVVAYALAGTVDIDLTSRPLGQDPNGQPVFLNELWPSTDEVRQVVESSVVPEMYRESYGVLLEGDAAWRQLPVPSGELYAGDAASTYVQEPPFLCDLPSEPGPVADIVGARVLAVLGDSVTTDHISPAGSIPRESPAAQYLIENGVESSDFNSYGARRGNHQVMMRGTFGNIRLRNALAPGREGDWTVHLPDGAEMRIFEAAGLYRQENVPLIVLAGKEYGCGSSRDWAAKGPLLLGVRAALAESYERIHRSNLVGMGILPLQYLPGESPATLGLTGREVFDISGIAAGLSPKQQVTVRAHLKDGSVKEFQAVVRIDSAVEVDYYRHGGLLPMVLRQLLK